MGNGKLDPRSLTSEERAIVDALVLRYLDACLPLTDAQLFQRAAHLSQEMIVARRKFFGEPASEPAKVECPNCGKDKHDGEHIHPDSYLQEIPLAYVCQKKPAQPEHVAEEMPEAVSRALDDLRSAHCYSTAFALNSFWRTHAAQPAKVRMTEELERVLATAVHGAAAYMNAKMYGHAEEARHAIAAVRAQAAEAGKVRLPKVNEALWLLRKRAMEKKDLEVINEAQREVDAAEGRK